MRRQSKASSRKGSPKRWDERPISSLDVRLPDPNGSIKRCRVGGCHRHFDDSAIREDDRLHQAGFPVVTNETREVEVNRRRLAGRRNDDVLGSHALEAELVQPEVTGTNELDRILE